MLSQAAVLITLSLKVFANGDDSLSVQYRHRASGANIFLVTDHAGK
jgi:hypothetical protein